ncbi:hypothetical protein JIQ42_08245 [Leishmania sp. Namibia]|uniref:hypothetical protein n=1 Tax=Leishmania sp. Namibia TaxID=2802991 RepID=UPI001B7B7454|nr:hypothetical protein JIQ42_08245 [Leishmania sp. Namibia]
MPISSLATRMGSWMMAFAFLIVLASRAAGSASLAGDEGSDYGNARNSTGATAHNTDSCIDGSGAPNSLAAGLPTCQALYQTRALSSAPLLSGDCVLPRISKRLSGDRRDDLIRQASSPEAAALIFTWRIGPRTPAQQAPLHSAFPHYFMNASGGVAGELRTDARTARRVRSYNALYPEKGQAAARSPAAGRHRGGTEVRSGPHGSSVQGGKRERGASSSFIMGSVRATAQSVMSAVAVVVDASGLGHHVQCAATEVMANLRVFAWRSATAWVQLFLRRRVVLRIPIELWAGTAAAASAAPVADGDDRGGAGGSDRTANSGAPPPPMLSRMAMLTHGSLSLLRVVSFPPIVQLAPSPLPSAVSGSSLKPTTASFVCALPAVHAASLLLQEDAAARRREAQQAAAAAGVAVFPIGKLHRARPGPPSSSLSPWLWMMSMLRNAVYLAARLLVGVNGDDDAAAAAAAAWSRAASISADDGVSRSAAVAAARGFLARVREELGPHQDFGESVLPIALQQMLGSRAMHTHVQLVEEEVAVANEEGARFFMQWEASLPAGAPMCLALAALPPSSLHMDAAAAGVGFQPSSAADGLPVSLEETCSFDTVWLQLLIVSWVVWQLERRVAQSTLVLHLATGLIGILLLLLMLLWYTIRRVQGTFFQLVMLAIALLLSGSTAIMDGLGDVVRSVNAIIVYLSESAHGGDADGGSSSSIISGLFVLGAGVLLLICVGSGILLNWLVPPAVLRATTFWCVRGLLLMLWGLCVLRNTEATVVVILLWTLWKLRSLARVASRFTRLSESGKSLVLQDNDPLDEVPYDARQAREYVTPLAVSSWPATAGNSSSGYASLGTSKARLKRYEEEGAACTRRALEKLAAHLRANPGRYATRLRDPNGVQLWAGAASTETDEEDLAVAQ